MRQYFLRNGRWSPPADEHYVMKSTSASTRCVACEVLAFLVLIGARMKIALIALLAIASSASMLAGEVPPTQPTPDAGASVLLLGMGLGALGLARRAFRR